MLLKQKEGNLIKFFYAAKFFLEPEGKEFRLCLWLQCLWPEIKLVKLRKFSGNLH